ncbi:hypothetical protein [Methylobacterium gnaphalii]|uniref:Uncharacterized protein n=1 Tax=Methylobacterium gnaphalii TaxID=1010610 RepID=A0A512JP80_9HYPH|nr:hypothetical protein [Methylobacterium gnaphalii]GEP11761.1 hypothetical protein MGN01_36060 [Methylobacterium gnaphalii]GJD69437.1 hypothetical protein MMMDOFMJ_2368 [Methylobacterium gnaphalii]GLS49604.1 hypothetical protein GCM10007885_24530 [Methylobacterium gnaphalii]
MLKLAVVIPLCLLALPARAAFIEGKLAFACEDLKVQRRLDDMVDDKEAQTKLIQRGLDTGQCSVLPEGLKVRIEENSWPYACVRKIGSIDACVWVRQRNVNVREQP